MRILGLDPGSHLTGIGIVETSGSGEIRYLHHELVRAPKAALEIRLQSLYDQLSVLTDRFKPEVVMIERVFLGKNVDSAFVLGHARGVCLLALQKYKPQVLEISAKEVKKLLTGSGAASKEQVRQMVCQWLRVELAEKEMDVSDALSLAISGSFEYEKRLRLKQLEGNP